MYSVQPWSEQVVVVYDSPPSSAGRGAYSRSTGAHHCRPSPDLLLPTPSPRASRPEIKYRLHLLLLRRSIAPSPVVSSLKFVQYDSPPVWPYNRDTIATHVAAAAEADVEAATTDSDDTII